ncbi:MAG: T9SS type A sorting domain-containing protein, partial [Bacteroidales bacterium]|nr:T9SS type A sorting domain-containing protein [Bacteroidales bacterium]
GSTYTITGLAPNMYVFTVSGGSGCVSGISEEVTIFPRAEEVNPPVVGNVTQPTCNNEFGSVVLSGLPAVGMWTLIQYPGQIYTNGLGSTLVISGLSPGTYSWIVTDPRGCSSPISEQVVINSVSSGAVPEITLKYNDLLICADKDNSFTSYQWFDEGKVIPNATGQYYQTHKKPGVYHVVTVDVNGCTNTSNTITLEAEKSLSAFPNPTSGSFSLSLNNFSEGEAIVRILSSAGLKVMEFNVESLDATELKQIPVDKLENGVYIIQVTVNKAENYFTRIVVAK